MTTIPVGFLTKLGAYFAVAMTVLSTAVAVMAVIQDELLSGAPISAAALLAAAASVVKVIESRTRQLEVAAITTPLP